MSHQKTHRIFASLATALLTICVVPSASAARFANQFAEFELPPQWQCSLEGSEWVCQSSDASKKRDAVIILAAKLKGPQDSLDQYLAYLKGAKTFKSIQGRPVKSEPRYAKTMELSGHAWVDSLHLESEVPGFYTRYLATVKNDIGVLVTYSINKTKYQSYVESFDNMVKTLKVFRKMGAPINTAGANTNLFQNTTIPSNISESTVFSGATPQGGSDAAPKPATAAGGGTDDLMLYGGAAVVVLLLLWIRKRRKDQ